MPELQGQQGEPLTVETPLRMEIQNQVIQKLTQALMQHFKGVDANTATRFVVDYFAEAYANWYETMCVIKGMDEALFVACYDGRPDLVLFQIFRPLEMKNFWAKFFHAFEAQKSGGSVERAQQMTYDGIRQTVDNQ